MEPRSVVVPRRFEIGSCRSDAARMLPPLLSTLVLALSLVAASPGIAAAARGADDSHNAHGTAAAGQFSLNLYRKGDFVWQYTAYWCVGASMQMMLNVIGVTDEDKRTSQESFMRAARSGGPPLRQIDHGQEPAAGGLRGAGSSGWARGLTDLGAGLYREQAHDGYVRALRAAAQALRSTNRPVGLIVWRGAHAWVVTGFTATADPLVDPDFEVTGVFVLDPWYPRVSSIWGPGQKPNSWISTKALRADFLPRRGGRYHAELAGKFVLVTPVEVTRPAPQLARMV